MLDKSSKRQNEKDLQKTLNLPSITIEQAKAGLRLLDEWKSEERSRDEYKATASSRWSEATVFKA